MLNAYVQLSREILSGHRVHVAHDTGFQWLQHVHNVPTFAISLESICTVDCELAEYKSIDMTKPPMDYDICAADVARHEMCWYDGMLCC